MGKSKSKIASGDTSQKASRLEMKLNGELSSPSKKAQPEALGKYRLVDLRERVVFYASTISTIAPILTTLVPHFVVSARPFGVLLGSLICAGGSAANYIMFVRKGFVSSAAVLQAVVTFLAYSISVYFSGGIHSQFLIFAPFMPVFGGFLTGIRGAIATTIYLVLFCTIIAIFRDQVPFAVHMVNASVFDGLLQVVGAIVSVGALTCIYEIVTERSERQFKKANLDLLAAKEKLVESETLLKSVISNVPVMILVNDYTNDGRYSLINKAAEECLGAEGRSYVGKRIQDLLPRDAAEAYLSLDKKVFESGKASLISQEEVPFSDGLKTFKTWKVPTYDTIGNPHLMIRLSIDITEDLKLKNDLELERSKSLKNAKLASLGEMSAGIAHEINNPLTIIDGTLRSLPRFMSNPEQFATRIGNIQSASKRISKIVKSLQKFSRTSDKSEYKLHSIGKIANEALVLTGAKARRHSTIVEVDCKSECLVFCDEIEIEQVLVNMINNAIDAVKSLAEKWVMLSIQEKDGRVVLRIRDSGPRIDPEIQRKLFQPFFTTKAVGQGTGLGLSIVKGILDEHLATIELAADDLNTCFEISFAKEKVNKDAA